MKKEEIFSKMSAKVSGTCNKVGFQLKKHSPEILMIAGITGTVVSAVMACKATTKLSTILDKTSEDLADIHEAAKKEELAEIYPKKAAQKDTVIVYAQTGVELAKLYGPAVILGSLSITSILASNNILKKRNVALAAAYVTVDKSFKEYRSRVVERFGEEVDNELRFNLKAHELEEKITDENGKTKTVKKKVIVADTNLNSDYARYFDRHNPNWDGSMDHNEFFLRCQQNYANDLLRANGRLTLNEVYDMLGIDQTKAGMVVGWIYDEENPIGDNFVEFDVHKVYICREEGGTPEIAFALDFNVDGNIYNRVKEV